MMEDLELRPPTVEEVCVFEPSSSAYGSCWGCPVLNCELRQDPTLALSSESLSVASRAVELLWNNTVQVAGAGGRRLVQKIDQGITQGSDEYDYTPAAIMARVAYEMALELVDPEVQEALNTWAAAEAAVMGRAQTNDVRRFGVRDMAALRSAIEYLQARRLKTSRRN